MQLSGDLLVQYLLPLSNFFNVSKMCKAEQILLL